MTSEAHTPPASPAERVKETIYTFGEELAHGLTHGVGALLSIAGLTILVAKAAVWGHPLHIVASAIFGANCDSVGNEREPQRGCRQMGCRRKEVEQVDDRRGTSATRT